VRAVISISLLSLLVLSCADDLVSNHETPPPPHRPDAISLDREAEEAALWLSGELIAPQGLYETIHDDLTAIRTEYSAIVPYEYGAPIEFRPWWLSSVLVVYVSPELHDSIVTHAPNPLDSLNTGMHAVSMDPFHPPWSSLGWETIIRFAGRKHPQRLAEMYRAVPGVNLAGVDGPIGDYSNVYPQHIPDGMAYLFRHGMGDCPAGCEISDFFYFRRVGGVTAFVGSFRTYVDPYPAWWPEASAAYCAFEMEHWGWPYCPWSSTTAPTPQARTAMPTASATP